MQRLGDQGIHLTFVGLALMVAGQLAKPGGEEIGDS
jgi:hypothetical protein